MQRRSNALRSAGIFAGIFFVIAWAASTSASAQGNNPVILIPGLSGSELRHKDSGERLWFKTVKSRSEDLRLPISTDPVRTRDKLIATDVLRSVKLGIFPVTDVYGGFIKAMETRGGYKEESWDKPGPDADRDSLFVYPYDWRLDNVENARALVKKIVELKRKLKKPDLRFDVVAHSMGGIITRYALMYGDADLPTGKRRPTPTWAGATLFDNIVLLGTPNQGSARSLYSMINGFTVGGLRIDLPFVQDSSKFTVFTIPAAYQLLPAPGTLRAFDENLKPMAVDLYDPKVWTRYGWNPIEDKEFHQQFKGAEAKAADKFFESALNRAKRLHEALAATGEPPPEVKLALVGSDCKTAYDGVVIYRDQRSNEYRTLFRPRSFTSTDGTKVTESELKELLWTSGDGVVSKRSLVAEQTAGIKSRSLLNGREPVLICEDHNKLAANNRIQDLVMAFFSGKPLKTEVSN